MTNEQKMRTLFKVYYEQCPDRKIEYTAESDTQVWIIMEGIELSFMNYQGEDQPIFMCGRLNEVYYFKTYAECDRIWNMGEDELTKYDMFLHLQELNEGWALYHSLGTNGWEYRIERNDDEEVFKDDAEAIRYVTKRALEGSEIHKRVILFLAEQGTDNEKYYFIKALSL